MSLSVIYDVTHDSLWLISKQDYGSPCEMSMQVNMPGIVQLHFEWSKTSEPCKGFYDGLEALKRFLSIFSVLIFNSKVDRAMPSLGAKIAAKTLERRPEACSNRARPDKVLQRGAPFNYRQENAPVDVRRTNLRRR